MRIWFAITPGVPSLTRSYGIWKWPVESSSIDPDSLGSLSCKKKEAKTMLRVKFLAKGQITFSENGIFVMTSKEKKRRLAKILGLQKFSQLKIPKLTSLLLHCFLFSRDMPWNIDKFVYCSHGGKIFPSEAKLGENHSNLLQVKRQSV